MWEVAILLAFIGTAIILSYLGLRLGDLHFFVKTFLFLGSFMFTMLGLISALAIANIQSASADLINLIEIGYFAFIFIFITTMFFTALNLIVFYIQQLRALQKQKDATP